jgi:hypothetical protein
MEIIAEAFCFGHTLRINLMLLLEQKILTQVNRIIVILGLLQSTL